jgi:hypothetical protein
MPISVTYGKTYKNLPTSGRIYETGDGRSIYPGGTFVASQSSAADEGIQMGFARGHMVELFDEATVALRAARRDQLLREIAVFCQAHFGQGVPQTQLAQAATETQFLASNAGTITVDPVSGDELEVTGTVSISGKFRALLNGVIDGTVFTVAVAGPYSHTFVGNPVQGDVVGVQAMLADGVTVASDPVNVTVLSNDISLSPVIAGDTVVTFSVGVAGTFQAQISSVDSGVAAAKTVGTGRTLTFGAPPVGGDIVGVYETTPPISGPVTVTTKFQAPIITAGPTAGQTSVPGTTISTVNGTLITLFVNGISAGTNTVAGNTWTVSPITALVVGDVLTARAGAGATLSALSAAVTITQETAPVVDTPIINGAFTVSGTSNAANGTAVKVFSDNPAPGTDITAGSPTVTAGVWTSTVAPSVTTGDSITAKVGAGAAQSAASVAEVVA